MAPYHNISFNLWLSFDVREDKKVVIPPGDYPHSPINMHTRHRLRKHVKKLAFLSDASAKALTPLQTQGAQIQTPKVPDPGKETYVKKIN